MYHTFSNFPKHLNSFSPFEPRRLSQATRPHPPPELEPDSREEDRSSLAAAVAAVVGAAVAVPPLLLVVVTASIEASGTIGDDAEGAGGGGETILSWDSNSSLSCLVLLNRVSQKDLY